LLPRYDSVGMISYFVHILLMNISPVLYVDAVLDEFPAPPGSAYPGARPGQPGSEQDQRPGGSRPYGQDQRPLPGKATDQRQGL